MAEELKCTLCFENATNPKLLQCFHIYCSECLVKLIAQNEQEHSIITCLSCHETTPIPTNGVTGLQPAFQTNLEVWEDLRKAKDPISQLDDKQISSKTPPPCPEHAEDQKLYCETCERLICFLCTIKKHNGHKYDLVSEIFQEQKEEIKGSLKPVEHLLTSVNEALTQFSVRSEEIADQRAAIEAEIHLNVRLFYELIDARKTDIIRNLHQIMQKKLEDLAVQRCQVESAQSKLDSFLQFSKETLKTDSQGEILNMKTSILEEVRQLTSDFEWDVLNPKTEADIKLSVASDINSKFGEFGRIYTLESPDPLKSHATGKGLVEAMTRSISSVCVQVMNFKGELCNLDSIGLQCKLVSEKTGDKIECIVANTGVGQYKIYYRLMNPGKFQLHIKIKDQHIKGSPFTVRVKQDMFDSDSENGLFTQKKDIAHINKTPLKVKEDIFNSDSAESELFVPKRDNVSPLTIKVKEGIFDSDSENELFEDKSLTWLVNKDHSHPLADRALSDLSNKMMLGNIGGTNIADQDPLVKVKDIFDSDSEDELFTQKRHATTDGGPLSVEVKEDIITGSEDELFSSPIIERKRDHGANGNISGKKRITVSLFSDSDDDDL